VISRQRSGGYLLKKSSSASRRKNLQGKKRKSLAPAAYWGRGVKRWVQLLKVAEIAQFVLLYGRKSRGLEGKGKQTKKEGEARAVTFRLVFTRGRTSNVNQIGTLIPYLPNNGGDQFKARV